jgi:hypothetical protein
MGIPIRIKLFVRNRILNLMPMELEGGRGRLFGLSSMPMAIGQDSGVRRYVVCPAANLPYDEHTRFVGNR